jgi:hypothetical protein
MIFPFRHGCDFGFDFTYRPSRDPTFLFEHTNEGFKVSLDLKQGVLVKGLM